MTSQKLLLCAIAAATFALVGCSSTGPRLPERVLMPVAAVCPVPDIPANPAAPTSLHDRTALDKEKARAIALYLEQRQARIKALEALLDGYAKSDAK